MKKYGILFIVVALIIFIVVQGGMMKNGEKQADNSQNTVTLLVTAREAEFEDIIDGVYVTGNIMPKSSVTVFSKNPGEVEEIHVDEGDYVRKRQILAVVDREKTTLQYRQAKAVVRMAEVNLSATETEHKRLQDLHAKNAIPQHQMDMISAKYEVAKAQLDQAKASFNLVESQLNDCTIIAPINGIVSKRFIDEGEMINNSPLLDLVDMDLVEIKVNITEKDINKVSVGKKGDITVDAYPDDVFSGQVTLVSPIIDPQSRTAEVTILIDNKEHPLKPGMFARVHLIYNRYSHAMVIPYDAVIQKGTERSVFLFNGGTVHKKPVILGITSGEKIQVISGLTPSEKIVVFGQQRLKDGMKVKIIKDNTLTINTDLE